LLLLKVTSTTLVTTKFLQTDAYLMLDADVRKEGKQHAEKGLQNRHFSGRRSL